MTKAEQAEFLNDLIGSVQQSLNERVHKIPAEWDGIELRQWIADEFAANVMKMDRSRAKEYANAIASYSF